MFVPTSRHLALPLAVLCLALAGCGGDKGGGKPPAAPPDTHALLTEELIVLTNTFADTIAGVRNAEEAKIAVPRLKDISVEFERLARRMEKIGLPSAEQRRVLDPIILQSKVDLKDKATRMTAVMLSKGNEEIGQVLHEGIDNFHKHLAQFEILEQWTDVADGGDDPPQGAGEAP